MHLVVTTVILFTCVFCVSACASAEKREPDLQLSLREDDLLYVVKEPPPPRIKRDTEQLEGSGSEEEDDFPSATPDLGDAVFFFIVEFRITAMELSEFNMSENRQQFLAMLSDSFKDIPAFSKVYISVIRQGSTIVVNTTIELDASKVNEVAISDGWPTVEESLVKACESVVQNPQFNITDNSDSWRQSARNVADQAVYLCSTNSSARCPWGTGLNCSNNTVRCTHVCQGFDCGERGTCSVAPGNQPFCRCEENYSGSRCEIVSSPADMGWETVLAISGGVGGALVLILVVVLVITCCLRKRGKSPDLRTQNGTDPMYGRYASFSSKSSNVLGRCLFKTSQVGVTGMNRGGTYTLTSPPLWIT